MRDTASGARVDRKELQRMLTRLERGDVVTVTRIDRLARSLFDLFAIVQRINESGAVLRSIAEPWADTGTGRMMLAVMAGMADVERDLIRTRTAEGRAKATARGQHMGRPPKLSPEQKREALERREAGEAPAEIARSYNVNRMTITRLTR
ncbi:recombinase family protein [Bradyrhizobium septentrionale]|uniref:recombinase family protein n=1 Tax=Bradyrhizobium septentrionale TaxID=1404411 RepID=UPI001CCC0AE5|nr:recombinase family protein [Bradyrhizobium septentrionale]